FAPKTVKENEYTNMSQSLMGKEKDPGFANPSVPAGSSPLGNEPWSGGNLSTKGTLIATITPDGILVVRTKGKTYRAQRDLKAKTGDNAWQQRLASLLEQITETDGKKYAKAAHKAMKLADTSFNTDGVTKIDTGKKEGSEFTNDAEKKPDAGGAM